MAAPAPPAEVLVDDAYREILLRLPADRPKLLYRFEVVSPTWRTILTDPAFLGRYREFHRLPHFLGYLHDGFDGPQIVASFVSTANSTFRPRVPQEGLDLHVIDSRHGLVVFERFGEGFDPTTFIIWDPIADIHHEMPLPEEFGSWGFNFAATVLCDAPGCDHLDCHGVPFRVLFVGSLIDEEGGWATSAYTYSSASGSWTPSPAAAVSCADEDDVGFTMPAPSILVGANTLYFRSPGRILQYRFDDEIEKLMYVDIPPFVTQEARGTVLMPAADGRLSFAALFGDMTVRFWETEVSDDGAVDWVQTQNALVNIPVVPGVRLIGSSPSLLFILTKKDEIMSVEIGSGRVQILPKPATRDWDIHGLIPFVSFRAP